MAKAAPNLPAKPAFPVAKSANQSDTNARATKPDAMSGAAGKSPKAGKARARKDNPPNAKRGACLDPPC